MTEQRTANTAFHLHLHFTVVEVPKHFNSTEYEVCRKSSPQLFKRKQYDSNLLAFSDKSPEIFFWFLDTHTFTLRKTC